MKVCCNHNHCTFPNGSHNYNHGPSFSHSTPRRRIYTKLPRKTEPKCQLFFIRFYNKTYHTYSLNNKTTTTTISSSNFQSYKNSRAINRKKPLSLVLYYTYATACTRRPRRPFKSSAAAYQRVSRAARERDNTIFL